MKILEKYEVPDKKVADVFVPSYRIPPHLVPDNFDANYDSVYYDFSKEDTVLKRV